MRVWREVRFPTVSNSILQTVRKHAATLQTPGKCVEDMCVFTPHDETFFLLQLSEKSSEISLHFPNAFSPILQVKQRLFRKHCRNSNQGRLNNTIHFNSFPF